MTYIMQRSNESHLILPVRPIVKGFFKLTAIRPDGRRRPLTGWFPNIITNGGLDRMGSGAWMSHCHVGSGSATPAATDTALQTFVAQTSNMTESVAAAQSEAPYFGSRTNTYRFGTGAAEGNLSEVGVGWSDASSGPLYSRALIVDGAGSPTTITVLADEVLDVTYQLQLIPPTADETYNVTDSGPAGVVHAITLRAGSVTSPLSNTSSFGWGFGDVGGAGNPVRLTTSASGAPRAYSGAIGAITGVPAGTFSNASSASDETYVGSSLKREAAVSFGLGAGNFEGGIPSLRICWTGGGTWQVGFDPAIDKDDTKTLALDLEVVWSRAT